MGHPTVHIYYLSVPTLSLCIISFTHLDLSRLHLNSVETIIFINHPHHIVSNVYVWTKDEETIDIPFEHLKATRVNYPNNCRSLALKSFPALEGKRIQQLFLQIGSLENHAVEIQLGGVTLDCRRNIREHSLQSNGDAIRLDRENVSRAYMVDISQRVFVEQDPANGCRDYPNLEYLSYEECDDQFLRMLMSGLTPVWMTEDFDQVSTQVFDENGTFGELLLTFFLNRYFHPSTSRCLV